MPRAHTQFVLALMATVALPVLLAHAQEPTGATPPTVAPPAAPQSPAPVADPMAPTAPSLPMTPPPAPAVPAPVAAAPAATVTPAATPTPAPAAVPAVAATTATTPTTGNALPLLEATPPPSSVTDKTLESTAPAAPANTATVQLAPIAFHNSLDNSTLSVLFTPAQIHQMSDALTEFESKPTKNGAAAAIITEEAAAPKIVEPPSYPVFYLSSIAYRAPDDWSIWVSGRKITASRNPTTLKVLSLSRTQAEFSWTPTYTEAIAARKKRNLFAPVKDMANKMTRPSTYTYNAETGEIRFTLRTNESFVAGYMQTFEGFVESPTLPPLTPEEPKAAAAGAPVAAGANAQAPSTVADKATVTSKDGDSARKEIDRQLAKAPK